MLVCEVRQWHGTYSSRDIPGGVEVSPYTTKILLLSNDNNCQELILPDGLLGKAGYPKFSKDGQWLYFQASCDNERHIYRVKLNGTGLENLTAKSYKNAECFGYRLSRNGTKILYIVKAGLICQVGIMDDDGGNAQLIAPELSYHYMADISADNQLVVFTYVDYGYILYKKDLGSGISTPVVKDLRDCLVPSFLPGDREIIFMRKGGDIYKVETDGTNLQQLTFGNNYDAFYLSATDKHGSTDSFSLSTDGKKIAYIARVDNSPQLHVISTDGSNQCQIIKSDSPCGRPAFNPNGSQLGFVSWEENNVQLYSIDLASKRINRHTSISGAVYSYDWGES